MEDGKMKYVMTLMMMILMLSSVTSYASPTKVIKLDPGGSVSVYKNKLNRMKIYNVNVVVDGPCRSACTMFLDLVKTDKICTTDKGEFWFHSSFVKNGNKNVAYKNLAANYDEGIRDILITMTRNVSVNKANEFLLATYPDEAKKIIKASGGLTKDWIVIPGNKIIRKCDVK